MATKKDKPEAVQNLKLYLWPCGWADGGALMILARSAAEARILARTDASEGEPYQGAVAAVVKEKPRVFSWPTVVTS